jgi:hypothetical protein
LDVTSCGLSSAILSQKAAISSFSVLSPKWAFEAEFRNMGIEELIGELIMAMIKEDLFQQVLEPNSKP